MKNKGLVHLAVVVSLIRKEDLKTLSKIQKDIARNTPREQEADEFRKEIYKFLELQIKNAFEDGLISEGEAELARFANQALSDGKCGWWYINHFLPRNAGFYRIDWVLKEFYEHILFEAACTCDEWDESILDIKAKERRALVMFAGLGAEPISNLNDIANELKYSYERARQTKEHAKRIVIRWSQNVLGLKPMFLNK